MTLVEVRLEKMVCDSGLRLNTAGIQVRPLRRQVSIRRQMQFQGGRQQRALRVGISGLV